jgi:hypothetical protein
MTASNENDCAWHEHRINEAYAEKQRLAGDECAEQMQLVLDLVKETEKAGFKVVKT